MPILHRSAAIALAATAGVVLSLTVLPGGALAAGTPPHPSHDTSTESPVPDVEWQRADSTNAAPEAQKLYAKGFDLAQEAKRDLAAGKDDAARKKLEKALKKFQDAVKKDPKYYQAWNMIGYCSRKTGDLKGAFSAYQTCLSINPDYEEAHEYLGEAYVQSGDLDRANAELTWLQSRNSDEAGELAEAIESAKASAPDSAATHGQGGP
jgi:Tfp pilus assembly protein PilF